jgi:hypothetical protein
MATQEEIRKAAIERRKVKRGFGQDVFSYIVVNAFLIGIWAMTGAGYFWPAWVLAGWGIGVVMHAWAAFGQKPITEDDIEREMKRGGQAVA